MNNTNPGCQVGFRWPKLSNDEIVKYYNQIKQDKVLQLSWTNPGRIDPREYEKLNDQYQEQKPEEDPIEIQDKESEQEDRDLEKFDLFDEFATDEFNSNQVLKLTHVKSSRESDKKMASMDKILDDMRKKYESEQKNTFGSTECMDLVNDNFLSEHFMETQENENSEPKFE